MQTYANINAKHVSILRPQMYVVMLPLLAQYGTDADVTAAFQEIIDKKYTITIRCVVNDPICLDNQFQDLIQFFSGRSI